MPLNMVEDILSNLETDNKESIIDAINEVHDDSEALLNSMEGFEGHIQSVASRNEFGHVLVGEGFSIGEDNSLNIIGSILEHNEDEYFHPERDLNTYLLNKDAHDIFTEIQYKREDGTLYKKSVLSGGTAPNYTTRTVTYYSTEEHVRDIKVYALTYNGDDLISEVLSQ